MAIGKVTLLDVLASYTAQPVAVLCRQSWYRGVVKEVGTDYVILEPAWMVEKPGNLQDARPEAEHPVPGPMVISATAIEQACQPKWAGCDLRPQRK